MLTETAVKQAKSKAKPYKLPDGHGLYLQVQPNGSKLWRLKYRIHGKEKLLAFGVYPGTSLKQARQQREDARKQLAQGIDPSQSRKDEKAASRAARGNSFTALAEAWYHRKAAEWAPTTAAKARTYLDRDLIPALGHRAMAEIRRRDLIEVLALIEQRGALDVAKKCREWLSGIFRYALVAEVIEMNPATDLNIVAAAAPAARHYPHLPESELPDLLHALDDYGGDPSTVRAIKLLLLTGCRPGELRGAPWDEVDLDTATWTIPATRMKMRRNHVIPLPEQAVELLREQTALTGHRALIFSNRDKPLLPISENTMGQALNRMGYRGRQTAHGFRHLISTALNERGYNRDWIERQLSHGDDNAIRAVYNKAEYVDQRREMMQTWADHLDALRRGADVVPLKRAG